MDKIDVIVFASICTISFFYIFDKKNNNREKIYKEIDETIKKISRQ